MDDQFQKPRRFPRVRAQYAALVKKVDPEEFATLGLARSMSLGGCMLEQDSSIGVGTPVEVMFSISGKIVKARGVVLYEHPDPKSLKVDVGIQFVALPREDLELIQQVVHAPHEE
jgi:hypothetical protein